MIQGRGKSIYSFFFQRSFQPMGNDDQTAQRNCRKWSNEKYVVDEISDKWNNTKIDIWIVIKT